MAKERESGLALWLVGLILGTLIGIGLAGTTLYDTEEACEEHLPRSSECRNVWVR